MNIDRSSDGAGRCIAALVASSTFRSGLATTPCSGGHSRFVDGLLMDDHPALAGDSFSTRFYLFYFHR